MVGVVPTALGILATPLLDRFDHPKAMAVIAVARAGRAVSDVEAEAGAETTKDVPP